MAKLFDRKPTFLTISEFYDNYCSRKYRFDVDYQRKSGVWSEDKKSFLIDSILKNYPIPAIFLRPNVDTDSGKTYYDVVDGKQRLEAIVDFIENRVPLTSYFSEDDFIDEDNMQAATAISGLSFEEIKQKRSLFPDYTKQFWTYSLSIEYLYEQKVELVASVFDRLNRNGEPLTPQELRNAKYSNTPVLLAVRQLSQVDFWNDKLSRLKSVRMEDEEFISELLFVILEERILESSPSQIDELFEKYKNSEKELESAKTTFLSVVDYINEMNIAFDSFKRLCWTTHLYSLFAFAWKAYSIQADAAMIGEKVNSFYSEYFSKEIEYRGYLKIYKDASSSRTKSESQRKRRLEAMVGYCELEG